MAADYWTCDNCGAEVWIGGLYGRPGPDGRHGRYCSQGCLDCAEADEDEPGSEDTSEPLRYRAVALPGSPDEPPF